MQTSVTAENKKLNHSVRETDPWSMIERALGQRLANNSIEHRTADIVSPKLPSMVLMLYMGLVFSNTRYLENAP